MKRLSVFLLCAVSLISGMILAQERKLQLKKLITITSPKEGDTFKTTDPILVSWTSEGITGVLKGSLHRYQQAEVRTYGNNLKPTGSLTIPAGRVNPGRYFIRLEEIDGTAKSDSGVFSVALSLGQKPPLTRREPKTIEVTIPAQIRDRHSSRRRTSKGSSFNAWQFTGLPVEPSYPSRPSNARVGFENNYKKTTDGHWYYIGYIYRSRLFFDISQFVNKRGILLEAKLNLKNTFTVSNYPDVNRCGQDLYTLTGVWELPVKCTDTPGYHYKRIFADQSQSLDILQQVKDWITGAEENHGLLLTGVREMWQYDNLKCVSFYTAELYIKFREYE